MVGRFAGVMAWFAAAAAVVAMLASQPDVAHAKGGPDWIITGGALGEYAMKFYPETDAESELSAISGQSGVEPPADPGERYDIHGDGWLSPEYYARTVSYYPEADLLYGGTWDDPVDRWMQPDAVTIGMLDRVIATAKDRMAAGELDRGVVAATFRSRGMDVAAYTFTGNRPWADDTQTPMFVFSGSDGSPEFAMAHLAAVIEQARSGETRDEPDYRINVTGSLPPGGMWGGSLGHYRLPRDGQPGWFVPHAWNLNEPNTYYETTPGFDAFIRAAIDRELAERAERAAAIPTAMAADAAALVRSGASDDGGRHDDVAALSEPATAAGSSRMTWSVVLGAAAVAAIALSWRLVRRRR